MIDHYATRRGEARSVKLTNADIVAIRERRRRAQGKRLTREHPDSLVSIGAQYGISATTVSHIASRRLWRHVE